MEFNKPFILPALLGAETSAAEDENHWMLSLQFGELPAFRGVVGKLIVGEDSPWNNVRSHMKTTFLTSSERRGTVRRRLAFARKPRPLFRADMFQSWDARRLVRRSVVCPRNRLVFLMPSLESFDFPQ